MASYTPGTYTGKGYGVRGKVILEVHSQRIGSRTLRLLSIRKSTGRHMAWRVLLLNITFLRLSSISRWQFLWWWERKWCAALSCMQSPHA